MSIFDKNISAKQRQSLEFAEDQRESEWKYPSFGLKLFHGKVDWSLIHPFPAQSPDEKKEGDDYLKKLEHYLRENLDPDEVDRTGIIPDHVYEGLGKLKAFALKIPKEYGGMGFTQYNYNRAMHLLASYCGSTAVLLSAHQSIGVPQPLKLFGTDEQKKKYFPRFAEGKVSAFALTEPDVGSDPANMTTTATPTEDGKHFLLNGEKLWCTNGLIADVIIVMAVTPPKMVHGKERKQITAFILEMNTPGIEKIHRCEFLGLHGIQNGLIRFNNVKVPRENIVLGEGEGLKLALMTLNTGRLTLPAASTGIAKWCLHVSRQWCQKREQWGGPIGNHESVAMKLSYIASHTFALDAMTWLTSAMADDKSKDIRLEAAIAKYFTTYHSWFIADETLQIRGGQGYETSKSLKDRGVDYWPVERVLRDVRINLIIEGTTEIMHLFIAREALDPHLSRIQPLMSSRTSLGEKIGAAFKMMGHYALWYPKLWLPSLSATTGLPSVLENHMIYTQSASKKLARYTFHQMTKYQKKMANKQTIMNRIVDIGTDLFAIAAVCSYADHMNKQGQTNALELADVFCKTAQTRIKAAFKGGTWNHDKDELRLAKKIMANDYAWMENEIMK